MEKLMHVLGGVGIFMVILVIAVIVHNKVSTRNSR